MEPRVLEENSVRCRVFKGRRSDAQEAHSTTRHAPHGQQAGTVLPDLADFWGGVDTAAPSLLYSVIFASF